MAGLGESVDQSGCQMRVLEKGGPLTEAQVGGDKGRALLVPLLEQGKEQTDLRRFGLRVANLIDLCGAPHNA